MTTPSPSTHTPQGRRDLRDALLATNDTFITNLPKIELHVHIEGTLTPELRYKLAKRNNLPVQVGAKTTTSSSSSPALIQSLTLPQLSQAYDSIISSAQLPSFAGLPPSTIPPTFFQAYYSGHSVLLTRADFFDLAWDYFLRARDMNIRYAEIFFDPQSHLSRGVSWADMMGGLRDAQEKAATELGVRSGWVMCFLRELAPEAAMEAYEEAVRGYREMIVGFGLDGDETGRPPGLFREVFERARGEGLKVTAHCDVGQKGTYENIAEVVGGLGGGGKGADRVDHGLNVADKGELVRMVLEKGVGLTICPWAYLRRWTYEEVAGRMRVLMDEGVKVCVCSDSPAYMDGCWVLQSLLLVKRMCGLGDGEVLSMMRVSVEMSWAADEVKADLLEELEEFGKSFGL